MQPKIQPQGALLISFSFAIYPSRFLVAVLCI